MPGNIYIQSESFDQSTNDVLDWIFYLSKGSNIFRINDRVRINKFTHSIGNHSDNVEIFTDDHTINHEVIDAYWYRRGIFHFNTSIPATTTTAELSFKTSLHFKKEMERLVNVIDQLPSSKKSINKFEDNYNDKINNLLVAKKAGLLIPDTLVTNDLDRLITFGQQHKTIITKSLSENNFKTKISNNQVTLSLDTEVVDLDQMIQKREVLKEVTPLPSFYQEYIEKKYELRIFFLHGSMYSMAIFSQENENTRIDCRNIERLNPPRNVTYQLPVEIEYKLREFMNVIDVNSGSIDMIVTPSNDYFFLEVNPIGQYQWVTKNCNFGIDKAIAEYLIK